MEGGASILSYQHRRIPPVNFREQYGQHLPIIPRPSPTNTGNQVEQKIQPISNKGKVVQNTKKGKLEDD
jgi:hypothetical protein